MTAVVSCPEPAQLAAMLDEALPQPAQEEVQRHVDGCPHCQGRLDALAASDDSGLSLGLLGDPGGGRHSASTRQRSAADGQRSAVGAAQQTMAYPFLAPSTDPAALGRLGHYEILELVGRGGMGIVFKARDTHLARIVAIKALAPDLAANPTARRRFLREARAAAAVSHDHIITIYAVEEGDASAVPYIAMELIDGQTLQAKIEKAGPLELVEILRIGKQLADGLAAAHAHGLIHRDIKPANILLQNGIQRVKITDFGLARLAEDVGLTQTGEIPGTPQYMSPEQALGQPVDARSDLFSLGSVLYAMCTGRSPFRAETAVAVLRHVCDHTPRPVRELNPEIPEWLAAIVHRLLEKKPASRFSSALEVAARLGEHLARHQQPTLAAQDAARGERPTANGYAASDRRGLWTAVAVGLVAALVVLFISKATQTTTLTAKIARAVTGEAAVERPQVPLAKPGGTPSAAKPSSDPAVGNAAASSTSAKAAEVSSPPVAVPIPPVPLVAPFSADQARAYQEAWARHLHLPVEFTNSLGIKLRLIPPGEFTAGSTVEEVAETIAKAQELELDLESGLREIYQSESPPHQVKITEPFYLGVTEVTQGQYRKAMRHNGSYFSASGDGKELIQPDQADDHPLEMVTWTYAAVFCSRLNSFERLEPRYRFTSGELGIYDAPGYHLPTEAQWEFACRAGSPTRYWFGPSAEELSRFAWWSFNSGEHTHPVAQREPNPFGLYDMLGNVAEWCEDGYDASYYAELGDRPAVDPAGPESGFVWRIFKGGNYSHSFLGCRSAARGAMGLERSENYIGLRVALPAETARQLIGRSGLGSSGSAGRDRRSRASAGSP